MSALPPLAMHAFANASGTRSADLLIVFGPGMERFDYFRLLHSVVAGNSSIADVLSSQERFDNWFGDSPARNAHQAAVKERRT